MWYWFYQRGIKAFIGTMITELRKNIKNIEKDYKRIDKIKSITLE